MLLAEPPPTQYDFHFQVFGFPVRVTPFFWLAAAVLGWGIASQLGRMEFAHNPGQGVFLVLWIVAMFLSILIHELGHAFAMRWYGKNASIVLYHFGGLAIPDSYRSSSAFGSFGNFGSFGQISRLRRRENQLVISAAGPAAQLLLAAVVIGGVEAAGYGLLEDIWPLDRWFSSSGKPILPSMTAHFMCWFLAGPSIYWALLNLVPVYPLDGGQIARELFVMFGRRDAFRESLTLSLICAIGCALYAYTLHQPMLAILFVSLAVSSYQMLQMGQYGG